MLKKKMLERVKIKSMIYLKYKLPKERNKHISLIHKPTLVNMGKFTRMFISTFYQNTLSELPIQK